MTWDGQERRKSQATDIALIKQEITHIRKTLDEQVVAERLNTEKLIKLNGIKDDFKGHVVLDRWLFGFMLTMMTAICLKVFS